MLVGICTIPMFLTFAKGLLQTPEACAGTFYVNFVCLGATLYHGLLICIRRLTTMRGNSNVTKPENFKTSLVQISMIWISCFITFGVPFPVFGTFDDDVTICILRAIFEENNTIIFGLFGMVLMVPFIGVHVLYAYLLMDLRTRWKSVDVVGTSHTTHDLSQELNNIGERVNKYEFDHKGLQPVVEQLDKDPNKQSVAKPADIPEPVPSTSKDLPEPKQRIIHVYPAGSQTVNEARNIEESHPNVIIQDLQNPNQNKNEKLESDRQIRNAKGSHENRLAKKIHNRILATVGVILIALDVCMIPSIVYVVINRLNPESLSQNIRIICFAMAMLNSALNPVINVSMIKQFRQILLKKANKVLHLG